MNAPVARFTTAQLVAQLVALVATTARDLRGWCAIAPTPEAESLVAAAAMLWRRVVGNPNTPCSVEDLDAREREALEAAVAQGWLEAVHTDPDSLAERGDLLEFTTSRAPYQAQPATSIAAAWAITAEGEAVASAWHEAAKLHAPQLTDAQRAALFSPYREAHPEVPPPRPSKPPRAGRPFSDVDALLLDLRERLALTEEDPVKLTVRVEGRHVRARVSFPKLSNGSGACAWRYQGESAAGSAAHALREVQAMLPAAVEVG